MAPEELTHPCFEHRDSAWRAEPAAVHDADAAVMTVPARLKKLPHRVLRGVRGQTMQVATGGGRVVAAFQFSDFAPVDAVRREVGISVAVRFGVPVSRRR